MPALKNLDKQNLEASTVEDDKLLFLRRGSDRSQIFCIMNFNDKDVSFKASPGGIWRKILDPSEERWMGSGSTMPDKLIREQEATIPPQSFALYELETLAQ
jgi:maltooligosyltrehalose trehalohydrolase